MNVKLDSPATLKFCKEVINMFFSQGSMLPQYLVDFFHEKQPKRQGNAGALNIVNNMNCIGHVLATLP